MKKILVLFVCIFALAACSEETPKTADDTPKKEEASDKKKKEQDERNKELSQAMTDKYKELYKGEKNENEVTKIEVIEEYGVIKVISPAIPKERYDLTMSTVGSVWYQYFKEDFTPEHIQLWADGANVGTSFDPRFKQ